MTSVDPFAALRAFDEALGRLLATHGARWDDRCRLVVTARPGAIVLTEADDDAGFRPRLAIGFDTREPESYGRRIDEG